MHAMFWGARRRAANAANATAPIDPDAPRPSGEGGRPFASSGGESYAPPRSDRGGGGGGGASFLPPRAKSAVATLGPRTWLRVDAAGGTTAIKADKGRLAAELGVQARDLRLLDPHLHAYYPSAILCRDAALVVNIEFVKAVITTSYVLVTNADDGAVAPFVAELARRLAAAPASTPFPSGDGAAGFGGSKGGDAPSDAPPAAADGDGAAGTPRASRAPPDARETPFELRALEVALEAAAAHLEGLAADLEAAAHPALDDLTAAVNTANLERVRRVKTRLVRLTTRTETLREVLEKILDDDADMHDMNLTARALDALDRERGATAAAEARGASAGPTPPAGGSPAPRGAGPLAAALGGGGGGGGGGGAGGDIVPAALELLEEEHERDEGEIAQVEQVLETYFMQVDNTFNRLQTLCEYIDDTEDYINIELDNHRNQLIRLDLMLTAATFAVGIVAAISGIFGMNLHNKNEDSYAVFVATAAGSSGGALLLFVMIVVFCKHKGLF